MPTSALLRCLPALSEQGCTLLLTSKEVGALCAEYAALMGLGSGGGSSGVATQVRLDVLLAKAVSPPGGSSAKLQPQAQAGQAGAKLCAGSGRLLAPVLEEGPLQERLRSLPLLSPLSAEAPVLAISDVAALLRSRCSSYFALTHRTSCGGGGGSAAGKGGGAHFVQRELLVRQGEPPALHVGRKVLQGGRKHTTYVVGCELFRLEPRGIAAELQRLLAAAATLQPAAPLGLPSCSEHAAAAAPGQQLQAVVVQGDEVKKVRAYLMSAAVGLPGRLVVADA